MLSGDHYRTIFLRNLYIISSISSSTCPVFRHSNVINTFAMSSVSELSLQIHDTIKTGRLVCTFVSLVLTVPVLSIVFFCAKRISKRYSLLLALVQVFTHLWFLLFSFLDTSCCDRLWSRTCARSHSTSSHNMCPQVLPFFVLDSLYFSGRIRSCSYQAAQICTL